MPPQQHRPVVSCSADGADTHLVRRAQDGDREAFEVLVERHAPRLYAVVLRCCGDAHEAEEITQEAFLRAWRSLGRFEGRARFSTWLYRIGVNESMRRLARCRPETSLDASGLEIADGGPSPTLAAEHHDLQAALEGAIAALPPDQRLPLILRDVEGLSTTAAAEIMELGEPAFKSRLHRARTAVRTAVADFVSGAEGT